MQPPLADCQHHHTTVMGTAQHSAAHWLAGEHMPLRQPFHMTQRVTHRCRDQSCVSLIPCQTKTANKATTKATGSMWTCMPPALRANGTHEQQTQRQKQPYGMPVHTMGMPAACWQHMHTPSWQHRSCARAGLCGATSHTYLSLSTASQSSGAA
jgi:hypothetical protein